MSVPLSGMPLRIITVSTLIMLLFYFSLSTDSGIESSDLKPPHEALIGLFSNDSSVKSSDLKPLKEALIGSFGIQDTIKRQNSINWGGLNSPFLDANEVAEDYGLVIPQDGRIYGITEFSSKKDFVEQGRIELAEKFEPIVMVEK